MARKAPVRRDPADAMRQDLARAKSEKGALWAVLNCPIVGNAHSDMPLMDAMHAYLIDSANSTADKLKVLGRLNDDVMGLDPMDNPIEHLLAYLATENLI